MKPWILLALSAVTAGVGARVISSTIAQENEIQVLEQESPILGEDDYDEMSEEDTEPFASDEREFEPRHCSMQVCVGDRVRIRRSSFYGYTGLAVRLHRDQQKVTVLTVTRAKVTLPLAAVRTIKTNLRCRLNFCIGDQAKVVGGSERGFRGYVTGIDDETDIVRLRRSYSGPTITAHIALLRHARW